MATSQAFGNAFIVQTPALDRWGQQLYAEQKVREARQQQENAALDASVQKEIGKVRGVDTPEVIKSYQDAKALKMRLLFDRKLQNSPLEYNQVQQQYNQAYQNIFTTANRSEEVKNMAKSLVDQSLKMPNSMADDAGERLQTLMNTPLSQLQNHPKYGNELLDQSKYLYGGPNTDFSKIVRESAGQPRKIQGQTVNMPGGLQTSTPIYEYGNTPAQIKDNVLGALSVHGAGRDAAYVWDHLPESEIENVTKQFAAIPKEEWQKLGLDGPQDLTPKNLDSKPEKLSSYYAMKYFVENRPRQVDTKVLTNEKAKMDLQLARDQQMEAIRHANAKDLIDYKKKIDPNDTELNNTWTSSYLQKRMDDAKQGQPTVIRDYNLPLTMKLAYEINPDPFIMKSFTRGSSEPDKIYVTDDNKIMPVFYEYKEDIDPTTHKKTGTSIKLDSEGNPTIDRELSKPMNVDQALLSLGYKGETKKQLGATMKGTYKAASTTPTIGKHPLPAGKPRQVKQGGNIYTWSEEKGTYE